MTQPRMLAGPEFFTQQTSPGSRLWYICVKWNGQVTHYGPWGEAESKSKLQSVMKSYEAHMEKEGFGSKMFDLTQGKDRSSC